MEYSYGFDEDLQQEWEWTERYAPQPEILRVRRATWPTASTSGATSSFDTRVTAATFDEATARWRCQHRSRATTCRARFVVMATGCLSSANTPEHPRRRRPSPVRRYHTGRWPHEGVDFTGPAGGGDRHRLVGHPVHPDHRRAGRPSSPCSSAPPPTRCRRGTQPLDPVEVKEIKADYAELRAANRQMFGAFGARIPRGDRSALEVTEEERLAEFERRWEQGGLPFLGAFNDLLHRPGRQRASRASSSATSSARSSTTPTWPPKLTPGPGHRLQAALRRHRATAPRSTGPTSRLVDLRETPDRGDHPDGIRTTAGDHAARRHRVRHRVRRDDRCAAPGSTSAVATACASRDAWAAGPRTYLGLGVGRLPEPVPGHRPRQPVGAHQHDGVDRAARRVDRRLHRPPARARPPPRSRPTRTRRTPGSTT